MISISEYRITRRDKERARTTDLAQFLKQQGETITKVGNEYVWMDGSEKVSIRGNLWFNQYEQEGGDSIAFVEKYFNKSYTESVAFLLNASVGSITYSVHSEHEVKDDVFRLPTPNDNNDIVIEYLTKDRKISEDIVNAFIDMGLIYESKEHHNAVFLGIDENGEPRHAHKRGTQPDSLFKGTAANSVPEYSFHYKGESPFLFLFEAPIDMLSFISMYLSDKWEEHSYAAACSVSDKVLFQMLEDNPNIDCVFLALDNDEAGIKATKRIKNKLDEMGVYHRTCIPEAKDWNEVLVNKVYQEMENEECPVYQYS